MATFSYQGQTITETTNGGTVDDGKKYFLVEDANITQDMLDVCVQTSQSTLRVIDFFGTDKKVMKTSGSSVPGIPTGDLVNKFKMKSIIETIEA